MPGSRLLELPPELVDMILWHYVFESGGYHYDFDLGRLRTADGRKLDLAFMLTCRRAAKEVRLAAFRANPVHFSTSPNPSQAQRRRAGRFHILQREITYSMIAAVRATSCPPIRPFSRDHFLDRCFGPPPSRTPEFEAWLRSDFPQFQGLLMSYDDPTTDMGEITSEFEVLFDETICRMNAGEAASEFRNYLHQALRTFCRDAWYRRQLLFAWENPNRDVGFRFSTDYVLDFCHVHWAQRAYFRSPYLLSPPDVWHVPSDEELEDLADLFYAKRRIDRVWTHVKWRFSAAAMAAAFLRDLPKEVRLAMTNVILHEDHHTGNSAQSHGLGLLPFCEENPFLRVERRVNVWSLFINPSGRRDTELYCRSRQGRLDAAVHDPEINRAGTYFAAWITEALALPAFGMPEGSFSLVFDAGALPDQAARVFECVKLDAAWQSAWQYLCEERAAEYDAVGKDVPTMWNHWDWARRKRSRLHIAQGFPQAIQEIIEGNSPISCSFSVGTMPDISSIIQEYRDYDVEKWHTKKARCMDRLVDVGPSSQPTFEAWMSLRLAEYLPDDQIRPYRRQNALRRKCLGSAIYFSERATLFGIFHFWFMKVFADPVRDDFRVSNSSAWLLKCVSIFVGVGLAIIMGVEWC